MSITTIRNIVLTHFLKEILSYPRSATVRPQNAEVWLALFRRRLHEQEDRLQAALALADFLEDRLNQPEQATAIQALLTRRF